MSSNDTLKLYYYNMRGRAEFIRLVLAITNHSYEDVRFERSEWPKYKPNMISGQIPVLEFNNNGLQLPQSITIARYLARECGLAGHDNLESAKIDAIVDTQRDFNEMFYVRILFERDETKKISETEKFINDDLVKHCENLAKLKDAFSKNEKYFVGDQLSWADLFVYDSMECVFRFLPQVKDKLNGQFKSLYDTIHNNDNLKKYLNERPQTEY